jgi:fructose-1,6-bisphosphatase I
MNEDEVIDEVVQEVTEAAPHISSGLKRRREYVGEENPSGERQMEADVWANELLQELITSIEGVGEFASEENQEIIDCGEGLSVTIDPLDGSSNIPTNNLVGTIVGIYDKELPCKGTNLLAAFYIVYGPLTTLMLARDEEVNEYVIEEVSGDQVELHLASEDLEIPEAYVYGFGGNKHWTEDFRGFEEKISKEHKLRYGGAFVGDINQTLHHGGLFGYPGRDDASNGKYRLIFECNPVAYIVETAGGASTDSESSILEVEASELHQRSPFFAGTEDMVQKVEEELERP